MAAVLLAAFPILMLYNPRLAWAALMTAIVLSIRKSLNTAAVAPKSARYRNSFDRRMADYDERA